MAQRYPELHQAQQIVRNLEAEIEALDDAGPEREAEIAKISYQALALKEPAAVKQLSALHKEAGEENSKRAALEAAVSEAKRRLARVQERIRRSQERQNAERALVHAETFIAAAARLDGLAAGLAAAMTDFEAAHRAVRQSGLAREDWGALRIFTSRSLATAWRDEKTLAGLLELPTKLQETSFVEFANSWSGGWRRSAQTRIAGNADAGAELVVEEIDDPAADEEPTLSPEDKALIARGAKLAAA